MEQVVINNNKFVFIVLACLLFTTEYDKKRPLLTFMFVRVMSFSLYIGFFYSNTYKCKYLAYLFVFCLHVLHRYHCFSYRCSITEEVVSLSSWLFYDIIGRVAVVNHVVDVAGTSSLSPTQNLQLHHRYDYYSIMIGFYEILFYSFFNSIPTIRILFQYNLNLKFLNSIYCCSFKKLNSGTQKLILYFIHRTDKFTTSC